MKATFIQRDLEKNVNARREKAVEEDVIALGCKLTVQS